MLTPLDAVRQGLVKAYLEILVPTVDEPIIPLRFNPTEYQLQKKNNFAEIAIPGLESPPIQFIRGASETLSIEVLVDTSDNLEDVRVRYVNKLRNLMRIEPELHAPPIVRFTWDTQIFKGVLESLNISYIMFTPEGVPLRAKLSITLKEYRPVKVQIKKDPNASPDYEKSHIVLAGETPSSIAAAAYNDPGLWREITRKNDIQDPRRLAPGRVLALPRLR